VRIDNVNIAFATPFNDASNDYATTFTEGGSSVAVASGPGITDDGTIIHSAKVVLTNAKPNDSLNRNDINGDGITGTTDTSVAGQITINLTGDSTFAAYQAAIQAITFSNNSQNPDPADRIIHVTVNDGLINSNVATATIHVTPVNDAPNANNDRIVTNIANSDFVVPEWAFLANDTDSDSAVLDITGVSGSAGLINLSLSTNPGSITLQDNGAAGGSFNYTASDHAVPTAGTDNASVSVVRDTAGNIDGNDSTNTPDILVGDGANSIFDGGTGNDIIFAGAGNDTIVWNVSNGGTTDGHDFADGGSNTATGDTFTVNGNNSDEVFRVYSNTDDWDNNATNGIVSSAAHAGLTGLNANTEIVVTRNTNGVGGAVTTANIIGELDNIEEIQINTLGGSDTVLPMGNFNPTSLAFSTITIDGGDGNDSVDISGLTSDHRIVFLGGSGHNQVIGNLRPQDVVDTATTSTPPGDDPPGDTPAIDPPPVMPPYVGAEVLSGTPADDVLVGGAGDDVVSGAGGDDVMLGNDGADTLKGGDGDDLIKGGFGDDVAFGNAGNDDVFGGAGRDMLFGDQGNDRLFGDDGNDVIEGSTGNDTVYAGSGDDRVLATVGDGDDVYWGDDGRDTVDYSAYTADVKVDLGNGLLQHGSVASAQGGNDAIFGFENFIGGSGNDTIVASAAVNVMDGGPGNDTFVFRSAADANGDIIRGLQPGDKIDLSGIDANTGSSGNQSFVLFAGTGFTAAGQLMVTHEIQDGVDHTIIAGNTNNDTVADFKIDVVGNHALTSSDFHGVN
jgi:Ca2+-binding RTX toxin-like protein